MCSGVITQSNLVSLRHRDAQRRQIVTTTTGKRMKTMLSVSQSPDDDVPRAEHRSQMLSTSFPSCEVSTTRPLLEVSLKVGFARAEAEPSLSRRLHDHHYERFAMPNCVPPQELGFSDYYHNAPTTCTTISKGQLAVSEMVGLEALAQNGSFTNFHWKKERPVILVTLSGVPNYHSNMQSNAHKTQAEYFQNAPSPFCA